MEYILLPHELEFEFGTEEVIYKVSTFEGDITVNSLHDARITVRALMGEGVMSRVIMQQLFYVKRVYAMQSGEFIVHYYQVWREVSIFGM